MRTRDEPALIETRKAASAVLTIAKDAYAPFTTAIMTKILHQGVQVARDFDASAVKDDIKNIFAFAGSVLNVSNCLYANIDLANTIISLWPHLTTGQKFVVATTATLGLAGAGVSINYFGAEQNILAAGYSAAGGQLLTNIAKNMVTFFASRNAAQAPTPDDMRELLAVGEESRIGLTSHSPGQS